MSVKRFILTNILIYIWTTSHGINGYKTYNNRYTVAQVPQSFSGISSDDPQDDHPNDIISLDDDSSEIPMYELDKLNNISTLEQFYEMIGEEQTNAPSDSLGEFGPNLGRNSITRFPEAKCEPRDTVVDIIPDDAPKSSTYFPTCIVVKRCGGCCRPKELKSCQPTAISIINAGVGVLDFNKDLQKFIKRKELAVFPVENHDACSCQCKVKKTDCNEFHIYDANACQCQCKNVNAKKKCEQIPHKIWVPQTCTCRCREQKECTTSTYFDENTCNCISNRRKQFVAPILLDPDTNTQYTTGS